MPAATVPLPGIAARQQRHQFGSPENPGQNSKNWRHLALCRSDPLANYAVSNTFSFFPNCYTWLQSYSGRIQTTAAETVAGHMFLSLFVSMSFL